MNITEYEEWLLKAKAYIFATRMNQAMSTPRGMAIRVLDEPIIALKWEDKCETEIKRVRKLKYLDVYTKNV